MRIFLFGSGLALIATGLMFLWLGKVQLMPTSTLVTQPISIHSFSMQSVKFKTDHREKLKYDIDILLIQAFERRKMKTILGDNINGNHGELHIRWTLFNNEQPMEQGDSKKYALSTIQSNNGQWGLTIANVYYTLIKIMSYG